MIVRRTLALLTMTALAVVLAACGEKAQTAGQSSIKKSDAQAWEGTQGGAYAAGGWKAGDKDSWEAQLRTRAQQGQNEYSRSAATTGEAKSQ
jgi:opacity protein-like surface antigen